MSDLEERVKQLEETVKKFEKDFEGLDKSYEVVTRLVDQYQGQIQKSITELSSHFVNSISPMIKKIVDEELEKRLGSRQKTD